MKPGRPLEFDPETAEEAAMQTFWTQGFDSTSLQDLLGATHLSKSSLYKTFGDKQNLFVTSLARYGAWLIAVMSSELEGAKTARDFVEETFFGVALTARTDQPRGCLLMNSAAEFGQTGEGAVTEKIRVGIEGITSIFARAVKRGREDGSICSDLKDEDLAIFLTSSLSGLNTMIKSGCGVASARKIVNAVLSAT